MKRALGWGGAGVMLVVTACSDDKPPATPDAAPADAAADTAPAVDSSPGVDAGTEDAADAAACGITAPVQSDACTTCLRGSCCGETGACLGAPKCKALDDCVNACLTSNGGDAGSVAACAQRCNAEADADVRVTWRAYNDCLNLKCVRNGAGPCQ